MPARLPIVFSPSFDITSRSHCLPAGGTTAKRLRPIQKTRVATSIIAAGIPKASFGP